MSNRRNQIRTIAVGLATAVVTVGLLAACSGGGGDGPSGEGGVLTMATHAATQSLDPTQVGGTGNTGGAELTALYDTLMGFDAQSGEFVPRLAETLTPNDDFTQWTLVLRDGLTFSDGSPFDSAAVVFSMKRHLEKRSSSSSLVAGVTDYATPDARTVVFSLASAWNKFPYALASTPGMIVNPKAVQALGDEFGVRADGAGAGPFVLDSFRPGESAKMTRNDSYWGGEVPLDGVTFIHAGDGPRTYEAFRAGTVQVAFMRNGGAISDARDDDANMIEVPYSAADSMVMNNGIPITCQGGEPAARCAGKKDGTVLDSESPTADVRVRRAVAAAIHGDTLNQRVYDGAAQMSSALISEHSKWYTDVEGPAFDEDLAKSLVQEAKADGWNGTIRLSCHSGLPTWGPAIKGMLENVGMKVELTDQQDVAANITGVMVRKDFDLACFGSSISDVEPFFALNRDLNSAFLKTGGGNFAGYANPDVDAAISAGRRATSDEETKAAIEIITRAYTEDVPFLALTAQPEAILLGDGVQDVSVGANTLTYLDKARLS